MRLNRICVNALNKSILASSGDLISVGSAIFTVGPAADLQQILSSLGVSDVPAERIGHTLPNLGKIANEIPERK